jgi:hypothetical protein
MAHNTEHDRAHDLLQRAIEQAKDSEPLGRAMALLHAARVLTALDKDEARRTLADGVAAIEKLSLDGRTTGLVLNQAVSLGSAADPFAAVDLFRRMPPREDDFMRGSTGTKLVQSLAVNNEMEAAVSLLEDLNLDVGGAGIILHLAPDLATRRRAMYAARERWRSRHERSDSHRGGVEEFYSLLSQYWRQLEPAEAESWLDEAVLAIENDPDGEMSARFGEHVELHSVRAANLFQLLNLLSALRSPDQVEAILAAHPEVAAAAKVSPLGVESLPAQKPPAAPAGTRRAGFIYMGSVEDAAWMIEAVTAARDGDTSALQRFLNDAQYRYALDTDAERPNFAPRVFWPSCSAYKTAMYWAGKMSGMDAEPLLEQVPDRDLRLLSSVELAAGALGLPQHSGMSMEQRRN